MEDLKSLRRKLEARREAIRLILEETDADISALDRISAFAPEKVEFGKVKGALENFIRGADSNFTFPEITRSLRHSNSSIRSAFIRLEKQGGIDVVKSGSGRIPTIYRRNESFTQINNE